LIETHELLAYPYDANLLEDNTDTTKRTTETLTDDIEEITLEINIEKTT
jgi:hypothetical protein